MIDIHLIGYHNVGPREDKQIVLSLKKGKYLIKSPIWSGKSFLFFDGILYGLYGHSYRDILNKNSSSWYIKVLFEADGNFYLTIRNLGKNKNIKSLEFYALNYKSDEIWEIVWSFDNIINFSTDFIDQLDNTRFETLDTTRIPEIEEYIRYLLPPRQVFEHQNLFMQSSDNIFELQPKQRIDLLKQIFNLDFLESYKNKISEDKSNISTQIKIYEKDNSYQDKYIQIRSRVLSNFDQLKSYGLIYKFDDKDITTLGEIISHPLSDQRSHLDDTLFELSFDITLSYISSKLQTHTQLTQTQHILSKQLSDLNNQVISYDQEITSIQKLLDTKVDTEIDDTILSDLENKKVSILSKMGELDDGMYDNQIISFLGECGKDIKIWDLSSRYQAINMLIDIGKDKKNDILWLELEKKTIEENYNAIWATIVSLEEKLEIIKKNEYDNYIRSLEDSIKSKQHDIQSIQSKISTHQELLVGIEKTLSHQQAKFDQSTKFYCKKIGADCPFIEQINDRVINGIRSELEHIQKQKQDTIDMIAQLESKIVPIQSDITATLNQISEQKFIDYNFVSDNYIQISSKIDLLQKQSTSDSHKIWLLSVVSKITMAQSSIDSIKELINNIWWYTHIKTIYDTRSDYKKQLWDISDQIISYQKKLTQIQQQQLVLAEKQNQFTTLEKNKSKAQDNIIVYEKEMIDISKQISDISINQLQAVQTCIDDIKKLISKLEDIYHDNKGREMKIIWLKADLEISSWLFDVFNKEFMLYVMQNYLPVLTDFIISNLYKVVDYQIYIWVHPDGDALEIIVKDSLWDRDVKSLSWWQKAILRLCWILAISFFGNNKILFMDETINNIDPDTVEKVADMLTDFIKQNDLKFYTITHSTQIQDMSIWDEVISVDR